MTLDGTVLLVDQGSKDPMDSIMWNLQVTLAAPPRCRRWTTS